MHYCDASNYMDACYPVLLVSDTGMIRNPHYHAHSDTPDTLDYGKLEAFVETLAATIADFKADSDISKLIPEGSQEPAVFRPVGDGENHF